MDELLDDPWYWTHDAEAEHVVRPDAPPFRVARVAAYGSGDRRRFATLVHGDSGAARAVRVDLAAADLGGCAGAVAVSAGEGRFTVVTEPGRAVASRVLAGLDADAVRAVLAGGERLLDVDAYETPAGRRFVVVAAPDGPGTHFFTGLTPWRLRWAVRRAGVRPLRLRAHALGGLYTAAAGPLRGGRWYTGLTGDQVGRRLDRSRVWPVDLDARRTPAGVRYALVMRVG